MSTHMESSTKRGRSVTYIVATILLVVFAVIALLTFRSARETQQSLEKADQLIAEINAAGGTAPSREQIARVLGDDGGAVCANPNEALSRAILPGPAGKRGNRARNQAGDCARPGRPGASWRIIKVYCPEELAEFQQFVDELQTY